MKEPWGKKAVRIAIAIGEDADYETLQKFIGHPELKPLQANNPEALVRHIKWVSTAVLKSASARPARPLAIELHPQRAGPEGPGLRPKHRGRCL